jgi:FkbM family methyltransferase
MARVVAGPRETRRSFFHLRPRVEKEYMTDTAAIAQQPPASMLRLRRVLKVIPKGRHIVARWAVSRMRETGPCLIGFDDGRSVLAADLNDVLGRYVFVDGFWEPVVTSVFTHLLQPGQTYIDVGAHCGYFTLLAARRIMPGGRIIAFEPDTRNRRNLADNLALNECGEVVVEPLAVSEMDGNVMFETSSPRNSVVAKVTDHPAGVGSQTESVRAVSLDSYCEKKNIRRVDLVKMDIEGGEAQAIEGMRRGLASGLYRRILMELHPGCLRGQNRDPRDVISALIDKGHTAWVLRDRARGIFGCRHVPSYNPRMLTPYDGTIPEPPSHFLFIAEGVHFSP